jgi:hypothetical protein
MRRLAIADWRVTTESGLTGYLWQIQRFPMLEPHEEDMLAKRWRDHSDHGAAHHRKFRTAARQHPLGVPTWSPSARITATVQNSIR